MTESTLKSHFREINRIFLKLGSVCKCEISTLFEWTHICFGKYFFPEIGFMKNRDSFYALKLGNRTRFGLDL